MAVTISGNGGVTGLNPGLGKILQVVNLNNAAGVTTASTTMFANVVQNSLSITPLFDTSKILVTVNASVTRGGATNPSTVFCRVFRGSTIINGQSFSAPNATLPLSITVLDSPATTSATTYNLSLSSFNSGNSMSSESIFITLMEVAA